MVAFSNICSKVRGAICIRCLAICVALVAILSIMIAPGQGLFRDPIVQDSKFPWYARISATLSAPMAFDVLLDYAFLPTERGMVPKFSAVLVCAFFIPDAIISITHSGSQLSPHPVYQSMLSLQVFVLACTNVLILEFHDPVIWTAKLVTWMIVALVGVFVVLSLYIITRGVFLGACLIVLVIIMSLVGAVKIAEWICKHRLLIYRLCAATKLLSPGDFTNEQVICIFYVLVFLGYGLCFFVLPLLKACAVPSGTRFFFAYIAKFILIVLFVYAPGHIARMYATQTDVSTLFVTHSTSDYFPPRYHVFPLSCRLW
jgi:hypothetical protein